MYAECVGRFAQIAVGLLDNFHDESPIEFTEGILVVDAFLDHLRDELVQQAMQLVPRSLGGGGRGHQFTAR